MASSMKRPAASVPPSASSRSVIGRLDGDAAGLGRVDQVRPADRGGLVCDTLVRRVDRPDPVDHRGRLLGQGRVVAQERLSGRHGQQVRADPVELGEQRRPARFGDAEDRQHHGDPDGDAERGQRRAEPARQQAAGGDAQDVARPQPARLERRLARDRALGDGPADAVMPRPPRARCGRPSARSGAAGSPRCRGRG